MTIYNTILQIASQRMGLEPSTLKHLEITSDESVWLDFLGEYAFLGRSLSEALVTAQRGDWWLESRDGKLNIDNIKKYQFRTHEDSPLEDGTLIHLYHENLRRALRFSIKQMSQESEPARDPGLVLEREPLVERKLFFYRLWTQPQFWFWGNRRLPGLYTFDSYTGKWRPTKIIIKPDG